MTYHCTAPKRLRNPTKLSMREADVEARRVRVIDLYRHGVKPAAIAAELGMADDAVLALLRRNGHSPRDKAEARAARRLELIRKCAAEGMTITETAKRVGLDRSSIYPYVYRHGIRFRRGTPEPRQNQAALQRKIAEACRIYKSGHVAEMFGMTVEQVYRANHEYNVRVGAVRRHSRAQRNAVAAE